jgi:two-component system cell cycle sensor histidine kinase/response regulator CckA
VALTALAMPGDEQRIRAAGCDGYITKPIRYQSFLASVAAYLALESGPRPAQSTSGRILIVDDDPLARDQLALILAPEGYDIATAEGGQQALDAVERSPPDLILLDVMMPRVSGYQVAAKLKASSATKGIPIIMTTVLDDRGARMLGISAGAEDFISKPVDREELCVRVKHHLRLKAYAEYRDKHSQLLEGEVGARTADLKESESLYRATFDAAPVGIIHIARGGRCLRVNARAGDLLRYTREDLQQREFRELMDASALGAHAKALEELAGGSVDRVLKELQLRRRDGTFVWARVQIAAYRDDNGQLQFFIATIEDVTEQRALEAQLRQASRLDAIGQLAAGVAHDFNNLLSVVLSYTDLIASDLAAGDPAMSDLAEIKGAGMRAVALTRQLLAFSRQQVLQPRVVDLGETVLEMEKMLQRLLGARFELVTILGPDLGRILVDPGQLEQVIMNLVVNARDALPGAGRVTVETSEVTLDDAYAADHAGVTPGPHVMLAVSDAGTGIDKETQARMFEPFFTTKELGKGTGLGLATVFGIVRQSGGTIAVYSELGVGTTFKVYFPITLHAKRHAATLSAEPITLRGSETILLVEDEERVRVLVQTILRRYGYEVIAAQGSGEALLLAEQRIGSIDVLLTDMVMPHMNGRVLAERIRAMHPAVKVVYMSGYTDDTVVRHGLLDSTTAFLQKPITPEILARKVREVLA